MRWGMRPPSIRVAAVLLLTFGCRGEPTKMDRGEAPGRGTDPASAAGGVRPMGSSMAVASAERQGTRLEGPRAENEGRNFEGRLQLRVSGLAQPLQIRY